MLAFVQVLPTPVRALGRYGVVSRAVGMLLLVAALLKLQGLRLDAVPSLGILSNPAVKVGLIEFEIFLGVWLLSGKGPLGAWLTSILTFVVFAAASGYQAWQGQATCGCLGRLSQYVKPWHTCAMDVSILGLLALARPDLSGLRRDPRGTLRAALLPLAAGVVGSVAVLGALAATAHFAFGSAENALERLRGDRLSVRPALVDFGEVSPGQYFERSVTLVNHTDHAIHVNGGTSDCSCITTSDLPLSLEPGEQRTIAVYLKPPGSTGILTRAVVLYVDDEGERRVVFRVTTRISATTGKDSAIAEKD